MKTKDYCSGCYNDFYNYNNPMGDGSPKCWSLQSAKLVSRVIIGIDAHPPYDLKTVKVPNCWAGQSRRAVEKTKFTKDGYLKLFVR